MRGIMDTTWIWYHKKTFDAANFLSPSLSSRIPCVKVIYKKGNSKQLALCRRSQKRHVSLMSPKLAATRTPSSLVHFRGSFPCIRMQREGRTRRRFGNETRRCGASPNCRVCAIFGAGWVWRNTFIRAIRGIAGVARCGSLFVTSAQVEKSERGGNNIRL